MIVVPAPAEIDLSVRELRLIRDHTPGLTLPGFVPRKPCDVETAEETLPGLRAAGLVAATAQLDDGDWVRAMPTSLVLAFMIHGRGDTAFQSHSWSAEETVDHSTVLGDQGAVHLTVRRPPDVPDTDLHRVSLRASSPDQVWSTLAATVPDVDLPARISGLPARISGATTIGMVESQALVAAWRRGDPGLVGALVEETRLPVGAAELFRGLGERLRAGYRLKAFSANGGLVFAGNWFATRHAWLRMEAGTRRAGAARTASALVDDGTVSVRAQDPGDVARDVLGVVAGVVRERPWMRGPR